MTTCNILWFNVAINYNYNYELKHCHATAMVTILATSTSTIESRTINIVIVTHRNISINAILQCMASRKRNGFYNRHDTNLLVVWSIFMIVNHNVYQNIYHFVLYLRNMHALLKLAMDNKSDPYPTYYMKVDYFDLVPSCLQFILRRRRYFIPIAAFN